MSKKDIGVFGDPSYLVKKFDDVDKATYSHKSAMAKKVRAVVKGLATKRDNMYVYRVLAVKGKGYSGHVAHVAIGLNGPGRQTDYFAAVRRLLACKDVKMRVIDVWIDSVDDLMDVLVSCGEAGS